MNHRTKITLQAPEGVTESQIEGTYYWPDEEGRIVTTNHGHVDILKKHGYTVTGEVSIIPPAAAKGLIEVDEMGRSQLQVALQERGLSYPDDAGRADLAEIATAWNASRRRSLIGDRSGTPEKTAAEAPKASAATQQPGATASAAQDEKTGAGDGFDAETASYDELKGWLVARAIPFPANQPKAKLREMVTEAIAALAAPKALAS